MKKITREEYYKLNDLEKMDMYMDYLIDNRLKGAIVYPNDAQGLSDCYEDDIKKCLENTLYNDKYNKENPLFIEFNGKLVTLPNFESLAIYYNEDFYNFIENVIEGVKRNV